MLIEYVLNQLRERVFKIDPKRIIERIERKLPESDIHLRGSPLLYQAFLETLAEKAPGDSGDVLDARAAQRAKELDEESNSIELRHTPTDRIFDDVLVRALRQEVHNLRRKEFSSPRPPFTNVGEAAEWIEARSEADLAAWRAQSKERNKAHREIDRLADKYGIEITYRSTLLPYQLPDDEHVKWVYAAPRTYLYRLAKETQRMARRTGLPQDALVIHILTGLKPVRSRVRITTHEHHYTLPSGEQIHVNEADVTFRAPDFTDKELREIYSMVKGHVGGKGTKGLDDKDERLWTLVQDMGGPPQAHGTKGPFWRAVQEKINLEYPGAYTTPEGVKARYCNISKRLQPPRGV